METDKASIGFGGCLGFFEKGNNMIYEMRKIPVFLIDLNRDEDYALFLKEYGFGIPNAPRKKLSRFIFISEQLMEINLRRRYLCITLYGPDIFWSGDSELRPLGKFTSKYFPFMGRAITIQHYFEIRAVLDKEDDISKQQIDSYSVGMDNSVSRILANERFDEKNTMNSTMENHSCSAFNICPFQQIYQESTSMTSDIIPAKKFVSMYKKCYEPCELMEFDDYKKYLEEGNSKGCVIEPALDDSVEELYYRVIEKQPTGIVRIPKNILRILPKTFKKCRCITDVIFPDGFISVGRHAFAECGCIRRIYLPKSLKQIHFGAFHNCFHLVEIYYEGSESEWKVLRGNDISDKAKREENGIAKLKNEELMIAIVHFDCRM